MSVFKDEDLLAFNKSEYIHLHSTKFTKLGGGATSNCRFTEWLIDINRNLRLVIMYTSDYLNYFWSAKAT